MDFSKTKSAADLQQFSQLLSPNLYFQLGRAGFLSVPEQTCFVAFAVDQPDEQFACIGIGLGDDEGSLLWENRFTHMLTCQVLILRSMRPIVRGAVWATTQVFVRTPSKHCLDVLHPDIRSILFYPSAYSSEATLHEVLARVGPKMNILRFHHNTFSDEDRLEELLIAWATKFETAPNPWLKINVNGTQDVVKFLETHLSAIADERFYFPIIINVNSVDADEPALWASLLEKRGWLLFPIGSHERYRHTVTIAVPEIGGITYLTYIKPSYLHFVQAEFEAKKRIHV